MSASVLKNIPSVIIAVHLLHSSACWLLHRPSTNGFMPGFPELVFIHPRCFFIHPFRVTLLMRSKLLYKSSVTSIRCEQESSTVQISMSFVPTALLFPLGGDGRLLRAWQSSASALQPLKRPCRQGLRQAHPQARSVGKAFREPQGSVCPICCRSR